MPPPLPRFEKLPPDKRRVILEAAASEFAEHGFAEASFNRIIQAAGISKGAMYYYFADKADTYGAVLDELLDRCRDAVADVPRPSSAEGFWRAVELGLAKLTQALADDIRAARLARDLYGGGATGRSLEALTRRVRGWTFELLALGQELGAVRADFPRTFLVDAVTGLLLGMDRWFAEAMTGEDPSEALALAPRSLDLARDLLAPRAPSAPSNGASERKENVR